MLIGGTRLKENRIPVLSEAMRGRRRSGCAKRTAEVDRGVEKNRLNIGDGGERVKSLIRARLALIRSDEERLDRRVDRAIEVKKEGTGSGKTQRDVGCGSCGPGGMGRGGMGRCCDALPQAVVAQGRAER
jgi:hypothetical protein